MWTFPLIGLYRVTGEQWVDLKILKNLNIDSESEISFDSTG